MDRTKDLTVSGRRYQLQKMTPLVASRVHGWLTYVAISYVQKDSDKKSEAQAPEPQADPQTQAENIVKMLWLMAPSALSEETLGKIQAHALRAVSRMDEATGASVPVTMADGRWTDKDLEDDAVGVGELIAASLQFSLSPFFAQGLLAAAPTR